MNQSITKGDKPTVTGDGDDARGSSGTVAEDEQYLIEYCEHVENLSAEQQPEAPVDSNTPPNLHIIIHYRTQALSEGRLPKKQSRKPD